MESIIPLFHAKSGRLRSWLSTSSCFYYFHKSSLEALHWGTSHPIHFLKKLSIRFTAVLLIDVQAVKNSSLSFLAIWHTTLTCFNAATYLFYNENSPFLIIWQSSFQCKSAEISVTKSFCEETVQHFMIMLDIRQYVNNQAPFSSFRSLLVFFLFL